MPEMNNPGLANYLPITDYKPKYSDFVVRTTWFSKTFGIVTSIDDRNNILSITFDGTPTLLITMTEDEIAARIKQVNLSDIRNRRKGSWAILQESNGQSVWYI